MAGPPVLRGSATFDASPNGASSVVTKPTGVVTGDLLVAAHTIDYEDSGTMSASGWTQWASYENPGTLRIYTKIAGASEPSTYTFINNSHSDSDGVAAVWAFAVGTFDKVTPLGPVSFDFDTSNDSTQQTASITGLTDAVLMVAVASTSGSTTIISGPSGMTAMGSAQSSSFQYLHIYRETLTSSAATGTRTQTVSPAQQYIAAAFLVRPALGLALTVADTAGVTEAKTTQQGTARTSPDTLGMVDSVNAGYLIPKTAADVAAITESAVTARVKASGDPLSGVDAVTPRVPTRFRDVPDAAEIRENITVDLVRGEVQDYQFLVNVLPRAPFGLGLTINVSTFDPGSATSRTQDVDSPVGDYRVFGTDRKTPPVWAWTMWTDTYTPRDALEWSDLLNRVWDNEVRRTPGGVVSLSYQLAGRRRRVFGRPRRFTALPDDLAYGRIHITTDFALAEDAYYEDEEQAVQISMRTSTAGGSGFVVPAKIPWRFTSGPAPRTEQIKVNGTTGTWLVAEITGPVANPWVAIGSTTYGLTGSVSAGQSVTLSGRPWDAGIKRSDGAWVPQMLDPRARLSQLQVIPGEYAVTYGGTDNTGTSRCVVSWRNAYRSL